MKIDTTISSSTIPVLYYGSIIPAPSDAEYIAIDRRGYVKVYEEEPKSEQDIESKGDALPFYRSQAREECLSTVAKVQDCSWMADVLLLLHHRCMDVDGIEALVPDWAYNTDTVDYILKHQPNPRLSEDLEQCLWMLLEPDPDHITGPIPAWAEWARYIATNKNGDICVFSEEPKAYKDEGVWRLDAIETGQARKVGYTINTDGWDTSLTEL